MFLIISHKVRGKNSMRQSQVVILHKYSRSKDNYMREALRQPKTTCPTILYTRESREQLCEDIVNQLSISWPMKYEKTIFPTRDSFKSWKHLVTFKAKGKFSDLPQEDMPITQYYISFFIHCWQQLDLYKTNDGHQLIMQENTGKSFRVNLRVSPADETNTWMLYQETQSH